MKLHVFLTRPILNLYVRSVVSAEEFLQAQASNVPVGQSLIAAVELFDSEQTIHYYRLTSRGSERVYSTYRRELGTLPVSASAFN